MVNTASHTTMLFADIVWSPKVLSSIDFSGLVQSEEGTEPMRWRKEWETHRQRV